MVMMRTVRSTIDGQEVEVPAGTTILEAAKRLGIYIPTLCYHPDLPPAKGSQAAKVIYEGDQRIENAMPDETGKGCGLFSVYQNHLLRMIDLSTDAQSFMKFCRNHSEKGLHQREDANEKQAIDT